jgi:hypothetical protein
MSKYQNYFWSNEAACTGYVSEKHEVSMSSPLLVPALFVSAKKVNPRSQFGQPRYGLQGRTKKSTSVTLK